MTYPAKGGGISERTGTVLIVDDHEIIRLGVKLMLARDHRFTICGEAGTGDEAVRLVGKLKPDIVILDLSMPVTNGFQAAHMIRGIAPATKIVFYTMHNVPTTAQQAGADAFVPKTASTGEFLRVLDMVWQQL
jgi:DNA-binding NarL/FixJ family response regulator